MDVTAKGLRNSSENNRNLQQEETETSILQLSFQVLEMVKKLKNKPEKSKLSNKNRKSSLSRSRVISMESSLKNKISNLENENKRLINLYEKKIGKLSKQIEKLKSQNIPLSRTSEIAPSQYTIEQKEFMLEDYEKLLLVLNEKHQELKSSSPSYKKIANEKESYSSEILLMMIEHLKNSRSITIGDGSKELNSSKDSSKMTNDNSIVVFKPRKFNDFSKNDDSEYSTAHKSSTKGLAGEMVDSSPIVFNI